MLYETYPALSVCRDDIEKAIEQMLHTYRQGGKLLLCGNGGSAADSDHIVMENHHPPIIDSRTFAPPWLCGKSAHEAIIAASR